MRIGVVNAVAADVDGYRVLRPSKGYDYQSARRRGIFEALTQGVQYVFNNAVEGDVAEFGTASGFSALTIAHAMTFYRTMYANYLDLHRVGPKALYLFDSFKGLPKSTDPVDAQSPNVMSGRWGEGAFQVLDQEELLALCAAGYDRDKIKVVAGWYSETLATIPRGALFAMVHLDCDLYSSTAEVLDYLFKHRHLADGCCLFFDDWNCNRSSPQFGQRRAWREIIARYGLEHSDGGDYAVLGHKFIVHISADRS